MNKKEILDFKFTPKNQNLKEIFTFSHTRILRRQKFKNNKGNKMKFTIRKQVLETIISNLNPFLEKRDASAITSHIYFEASEGCLIIRATDQEMGLSYEVKDELQVKEDGKATANGKSLLDIIKSLQDGEVTISTNEKIMNIKQVRSSFDINMQNADDYPAFPDTTNKNRININAALMLTGLKKVDHCIDANNPKPEFTGALLDFKNNALNIVGTDGKRVTAYNLNISNPDEMKIILPKRAISEFSKIITQQVEIYYDDVLLIVKNDFFTFFIKLINGRYADYERPMGQNYSHEVTLKRDEIIQALRTVKPIGDIVNITLSKNTVDFMVMGNVGSKGQTTVETELNVNDKFEFSLKNKNMLDFLSNVDTETFILKYNEATMPVLFNSENLTAVMTQIRN